MRRILPLLALSAVFSVLAFAENWSGKLLDASCYNQQKRSAGCDATSSTTSFAIDVSGTIYQLDAAGNSKASSALKNRADRADPTKQPQSKAVMATVRGSEKNGTIIVEEIEVQ